MEETAAGLFGSIMMSQTDLSFSEDDSTNLLDKKPGVQLGLET